MPNAATSLRCRKARATLTQRIRKPAKAPAAGITMTRTAFQTCFKESGRVSVAALFGLPDRFQPMFAVVTPAQREASDGTL